MRTFKLSVNDVVYNKFLWLLSKFSKDEIEVIPETNEFAKNQKYLSEELNEILNGNSKFIEFEEAEHRLENTIRKHENRI